jgi:hypothetical protein
MNFTFKGHHYRTQFWHALHSIFVYRLTPNNVAWTCHGDDCCDYWTPISDPTAQRVLMLDDDFGLVTPSGSGKEKVE